MGILRGLCSSDRFCEAFSQQNHIKSFLNVAKQLVAKEESSGTSRASSVSIQVSCHFYKVPLFCYLVPDLLNTDLRG